ncbi:alkyl/aryl-sulfatase [Shewanella amazonensis]|uniref:Linear primary-alkylsulfatase n=2 Tax=Shewanella amazonensis TaxID=60478 RepID=A1S2W5_SHEAM|nr:alkyl sulfatase [Shewanella amazonensis SB2B]
MNTRIGLAALLACVGGIAVAAEVPKPATTKTKAINQAVKDALAFEDKTDFDNARKGFIAAPAKVTITADNGAPVWDLEQYKTYITQEAAAPETVNPSLWRNAQLNMLHGLFEVTKGIYQVRGYDLSNITFVKGDSGWIVFDPLISAETAKAAYELISEHVGKFPVKAVIYSHSHVDHFGGVRGLVDEADVVSGKVDIIAPEHFTEHAVSENVIAGNAMSRRAIYMYGALLPRNPQGGVNGGLGQTTSTGAAGLLLPTIEIKKTGEELTVDGVKMVFQMTPGTEAPAEMNTLFPDFKALWMAENTTNTMHNILTLRGAQVRDALKWSGFLNETIDRFMPGVEVKFQSHHWPMWGNDKIVDYMEKQRDIYKFTHDQTVRLMNQGYVGSEISEMIKLPPELERNWSTRGYYGTLRHNSRAVYQRYMGWYDGNPANLNNLPPEDAAKKYVEYMGGSAAMLKKAKADYDKGEYRWVAEVMKQLVFAEPANTNAKNLLADSFEQLGYQAESGPWRSVYLQGAFELRNGVPTSGGVNTASPDIIRAMTPEMVFDYFAVRLNSDKAAGKDLTLEIRLSDLNRDFCLNVKNAVLNYAERQCKTSDVSVTLNKVVLDDIQLGKGSIDDMVKAGKVSLKGSEASLKEFTGMLDNFNFWFNVVTP